MKIRQLTEAKDMDYYRHISSKFTEDFPSLDYMRKGRIYALYDKNDNLAGGFTLSIQGPFLSINSIPKMFRINFKTEFLTQTAEISGLWLHPELRTRYSRFIFWIRLLFVLFNCGQKYFVYSYRTKETWIQSICQKLHPDILYRGSARSRNNPYMVEQQSIETISRKDILTAAFFHPAFFIKQSKQGTKNHLVYHATSRQETVVKQAA